MGEGNDVRFGGYDRLCWALLFLSFPRLVRVDVNNDAWVSDYFEGEGGFVSCVVAFRKTLRQFEMAEYESLLSLLANVFI